MRRHHPPLLPRRAGTVLAAAAAVLITGFGTANAAPAPTTESACAAVGGSIVCAGGADGQTPTSGTYLYNPATDAWTQGADMPYDNWGMTYSGVDGRLQVAGGVTGDDSETTNQAAEYDPVTNTWSALPNTDYPSYNPGGGSGCGLYRVGGYGTDDTGLQARGWVESLPGYDQCGDGFSVGSASPSSDTVDLAPGQSTTVTVTVTSKDLAQPGTYTAALAIGTDTPYQVDPVTITDRVGPPAGWGELEGTVTDAVTGAPVSDATVQLCAGYDIGTGACTGPDDTLTTDAEGHYQLWLDAADGPLEVIVADDAYQQEFRIASLTAGATTTLDVTLEPIA